MDLRSGYIGVEINNRLSDDIGECGEVIVNQIPFLLRQKMLQSPSSQETFLLHSHNSLNSKYGRTIT